MTTPQYPWSTTNPADLPQGVVAPSQLGGATQDHTKAKYRSQAASRFPSQVNDTMAGNPANVSGPLGVIVNMAAGLTEEVANADPATIQQPSDIVPKTNGFFNGLPVSRLLWDTIEGIINGIHNGWFGGGGVGDPQQVQYTIEAIADAVINGYNVETKVTSGTWTKPANITELVVVAIGCGKNGANGNGSSVAQGGLGGGYLAQQIDPTTVASSTPYVVGTGGNPSSFGSHVVTTPGGGGIATSFGYTTTSSTPGRGGNGGKGYSDGSGAATPGQSGEGSALAAGGAGGAASTNNTDQLGGAGSNVSAASVTKCGGGGGGGGGGGPNSLGQQQGGAGGPGGYPGGGGGGGGGRSSIIGVEPNGAGGIGATGVIWIFWR